MRVVIDERLVAQRPPPRTRARVCVYVRASVCVCICVCVHLCVRVQIAKGEYSVTGPAVYCPIPPVRFIGLT